LTGRLATAAIAALLLAGCGGDGARTAWDITFSVDSPGEFGALQVEISGPDGGRWLGRGESSDCEALVNAIMAANFVGKGSLKAGLISLHGIATPAPFLRCGFESEDIPQAGDFSIRVVDAADTESDPVLPLPVVTVSGIEPR
jgi:hypothetical protein